MRCFLVLRTFLLCVCALKEHCTSSSERRVSRWEHEVVLEAMQNRLDQAPEMRIRRQSVDHPFGTLKL